MSLTPDQVRLRLDAIRYHETDRGVADLVTLLYEVLPDLVAPVRPSERTDSRQSDGRLSGLPRTSPEAWTHWDTCPNCLENAPCARARMLVEGT